MRHEPWQDWQIKSRLRRKADKMARREFLRALQTEMDLYRAAMVGGWFGPRELAGYRDLLDTMYSLGITVDSVLSA
jgi:hypothetical protein